MASDNEVSQNLRALSKRMPTMLQTAMGKACAIVRNDAIRNAPSKTGELRRSIEFEVSPNGTEGIVFSNLAYAPYVEVGTGIYAKKGGGRDDPWTYPYYADGGTKYATTVGMKARPYLEPAMQQNTTKIRECFEGLI